MPGSWVSPQKLDAVHKAALEACHAENAVISDPSECHFDPLALLCKKGQTGECLNEGELKTVQTVYKGLQDASGKSVYPGFPLGTESDWSKQKMGTNRERVTESGTYPFPTGFFRDFVFGNPEWDYRTTTPVAALGRALDSRAGQAVYAEMADLSAFRSAGGKLIQYHGWSDPAIPAGASIKYYESVAEQMGGTENIQPFYRLFLAPGLGHCAGGTGPRCCRRSFRSVTTPP